MIWDYLWALDPDIITEASIRLAAIAAAGLVTLVLLSIINRQPSPRFKTAVFTLMVLLIVLPTLYFVISTIRLNLNSVTGGPVHWHADFRIFACGEELEPPEPPHALSNKTGSPLLHEHEDRRIHVEGTVVRESDVSLANFFAVQGGELTLNKFLVPTANGLREWRNGDRCPNGQVGQWQVFVYRTDPDGAVARQEKLSNYPDYVPAPHSLVPPGDCLILEFGPPKQRTDHLCPFYQIEVNKGQLTIQ